MKVNFFNIKWDVDNQKVEGLPLDTVMEIDDDTDIENDGADLLSDEFGWCVIGFDYVTK